MLNNRQLINLFHVFIVAPLLWSLATNRFPEDYKKYLIWVVVLLVLYHLWRFFGVNSSGMENMTTIGNANLQHIRIFDSYPGYDKPALTIKKGDIVVWTNIGEVEHTVTGDNGEFNSGYLKPGENYSVKFDNLGTFTYSCQAHKGWMNGVIMVV
jgi:plastocyanin